MNKHKLLAKYSEDIRKYNKKAFSTQRRLKNLKSQFTRGFRKISLDSKQEEDKEKAYQKKFEFYYRELRNQDFKDDIAKVDTSETVVKNVGFDMAMRKATETKTAKGGCRNKSTRIRRKKRLLLTGEGNPSNTTMYHFTTPKRRFRAGGKKRLPSINHSMNLAGKTQERSTDKSVRIPSKNFVLNNGSAFGNEEGSRTTKFGKLPKLPERCKAKKNSLIDLKLTSNNVLNTKHDNFVSQQFTLDPDAIMDATSKAAKENKNLSFNLPDNAKFKDTTSDKSEILSKKVLSVRSIPMPKVTPFGKSISIKKHGAKLFDEEDEYLCKCFKTMCGQNSGENIRNFRLNRISFKNYLSKRYNSKIAETIVSCFDFSMPWDHTNYFEGLEVFVNTPKESLLKLIFHCLDYNGDGYISHVDLFILMKTLNNNIFVNVASRDIVDLVKFLQQKLKDKGLDDPVECEKRRLAKNLVENKNFKRKQSADKESPKDDYQSDSIFKLSALEKMANIVEKNSQHEVNTTKLPKSTKIEDPPIEAMDIKRPKKFGVRDISYEICENDESTMKCSLEEYLTYLTTGKLPDLLIDVFIYLGAKKYVEYAIEGSNKKNLKGMDSETLSALERRGKIKRQSTLKIERDLDKWRDQLGEETVDDFCSAFAKLCNDKNKSESELSISLESVVDNFEGIFGVKNDFLAKCIYYFLTGGYLMKDIRITDFIEKFMCFGTGMKRDFYNFIFNFFDVNKDNQVTMIDLLFFYTYLPKNTQFGAEIADSIELFSKKFIMARGRRPAEMNVEVFQHLFPELPCFVTEIMNKLFKKSQTIDMKSLNTVKGVKSALMIDPSLDSEKNPDLFYYNFDVDFSMNSYHVEKPLKR
ncbi:unnamed protein product [Moneuplotes crassus]|uniref:EF-hand domain-containing protein n=1 Tax=Euplotes crassus TaxID=5936 RepID=A0AAD1Y8P9_EUPCR|nr:unnamed protein product [Moneuplotes crassus]